MNYIKPLFVKSVAVTLILSLVLIANFRPAHVEAKFKLKRLLLRIVSLVLTGGIILIVDHNNCKINLFFGCNKGDGGSSSSVSGSTGQNGSNANVTYSYQSNFPPRTDPNGLVPPGGIGGSIRDSIDSKPCTQGKTCPGDELGSVVLGKSILVNPGYADARTKTCPLLWTPGKSNELSLIECKLISNNITKNITNPIKDVSTGKNKFMIPVGKHTLSCTRTTTEIVTEYGTKQGESTKIRISEKTNVFNTVENYNVKCLEIPSVVEI